jgi:nucleotide-binding universal stress UspA family protein
MGLHAMDLPPVSGGAYGETAATDSRPGPVVVVGYDGSAGSRSALAYAANRVGLNGRIIVVHVTGPDRRWFGAPSFQPVSGDYRAAARAITEQLTLPYGARCDTIVRVGSPPTVLERIATESAADEIAVGRHGPDRHRPGLGSVPHALLETARCPVVVVPTGAL